MTGASKEPSSRDDEPLGSEGGEFPAALASLETAVLDACAAETEWPAQIAAAVCAGVDFAIANPVASQALTTETSGRIRGRWRYERVIGRLAGFIRTKAPAGSRLPGSTDEAMVAGIVGLVGDHIRVGRVDRLAELRPELVLLILLPYLGFSEARRWANRVAGSDYADS